MNNRSVYKRGATWTAHMNWTDMNGRKQQKKVGGFETRKAATEYHNQLMTSIQQGRRRGTTKLRVDQYLRDEWLPKQIDALKASSYASYRSIVNSYLIPHLGKLRLEEVTARRAEQMFNDLMRSGAKGKSKTLNSALSAKTVSDIAGVLHRAYRDAVRWDLIATNPISSARKPSKRTKEMTAWTPPELNTFIEAASSDRLFAIWHLAATSGMRRGELLGLTWDNINFEAGKVSINNTRIRAGNTTIIETPKSRKSRRTFAIDERTLKALKKWKTKQGQERLAIGDSSAVNSNYVVTEADGTLPDPNTFTRRFKALCKLHELRVIRLHDIRHSYVVAARRSGADAKTVSERIGHADVNVTLSVYDHVFVKDDEEAATSISDHIYGALSKQA